MIKISQTIFSILALGVLAIIVFLTISWISPPLPLPADAPATDFSAMRAIRDLEAIAREPHPIGDSPAHAEVRDYILGEVSALGLKAQVQDTFGASVIQPGYILGGPIENILVRLPGTDPEGSILLVSHYDSSPGSPGAVDSGSGVVTILEILRALGSGPPLHQDVMFLFSDGEEPGMIGSNAFVAKHPWFAEVRLAINLDQFWVGPPVLFRTSGGNGVWAQALARSNQSTRPAYLSFPFELFPTGDTDLIPFALAGVPGAEFDGGGALTEKHTNLDLPRLMDPGSLQQAGDQILALIRYLGNQPGFETSVPEQTFFPLMGSLVHYPSNLAGYLALVAGLCFAGMIIYGLRKKELTWRGQGLGFLALLLSLILSVVFTNLIWHGILAFHPEYAYVSASTFRQKLSDDDLYAIGFIILTLSVSTSLFAVTRKNINALDLGAGVLLIWFPLTIATVVLIPAASYLFSWVLLSGSMALLLATAVRSREDAWILSGLGFLASAILAIFLWIPLFSIAILAGPMSPDTPLLSLLIVLVTVWLGSLVPILDWITHQNRWLFPVLTLAIALGFLTAGNYLVGRESPPPLANPIGYWLDANDGAANWVAFSQALDERQDSLLVNPVQRPYTELLPEAPHYLVLTSGAPVLDSTGPRLEVLADDWVVDHRVMKTRITTSLGERILIYIPDMPTLSAISVLENARIELPPYRGEWVLRFEGLPDEGIEIAFEFMATGQIRFLLVEEKTGLPAFTGLMTQPAPGTMKSPGVFTQDIPTDFTLIKRSFVLPETPPISK